MITTYLKREFHYSKELFLIKNKLETWDLEPVEGKSVVSSNSEHYAHIELKIYKNQEDRNFIDWKITNEQIPHEIGYKDVVEKVLKFFIAYLEALRGENLGLIFEINNGSFKKYEDTKRDDFNRATFLALINCFDKTNEDFSKEIFPKKSGNEYTKEYLSKSFKEKIEQSLMDENVINEIQKILINIEKSSVIDLLNIKGRDQLAEIITSKLNRPKIYDLFEKGILTKYGDLTLVGLSHILKYYGEFDLKKIMPL